MRTWGCGGCWRLRTGRLVIGGLRGQQGLHGEVGMATTGSGGCGDMVVVVRIWWCQWL